MDWIFHPTPEALMIDFEARKQAGHRIAALDSPVNRTMGFFDETDESTVQIRLTALGPWLRDPKNKDSDLRKQLASTAGRQLLFSANRGARS